MTNERITEFFARYEKFFMQSLAGGEVDAGEMAALYAPEFIAASPLGVMAGKNDEPFRQALGAGYEQYRAIGTKGMAVRDVHVSPIDALHCVAHVAWRAEYAAAGKPDVIIDFEVHYLMQDFAGNFRIFGWVSGNEQELLQENGIG